MNMTFKISMISIVAFLLIGVAQAYAQKSCYTMVERIPGISLDDSQKAALTARDAEHTKKMIRLRADYDVARVDKQNLLKDRNFKKDAVAKQIRTMMSIKTDKELAHLEAMDELRKVLTDQQWALVTSHMGQRGMDMGMDCPRGGSKGAFHKGKGHDMGAMTDGKAHRGYKKDCPFAEPDPAK